MVFYQPFLYQTEVNGIKKLTGLDYELVKVFAKKANLKIDYKHIFWEDLLSELKKGDVDIGIGALYTKERAEFAYFSLPYRYSEASIFLPSDSDSGFA